MRLTDAILWLWAWTLLLGTPCLRAASAGAVVAAEPSRRSEDSRQGFRTGYFLSSPQTQRTYGDQDSRLYKRNSRPRAWAGRPPEEPDYPTIARRAENKKNDNPADKGAKTNALKKGLLRFMPRKSTSGRIRGQNKEELEKGSPDKKNSSPYSHQKNGISNRVTPTGENGSQNRRTGIFKMISNKLKFGKSKSKSREEQTRVTGNEADVTADTLGVARKDEGLSQTRTNTQSQSTSRYKDSPRGRGQSQSQNPSQSQSQIQSQSISRHKDSPQSPEQSQNQNLNQSQSQIQRSNLNETGPKNGSKRSQSPVRNSSTMQTQSRKQSLDGNGSKNGKHDQSFRRYSPTKQVQIQKQTSVPLGNKESKSTKKLERHETPEKLFNLSDPSKSSWFQHQQKTQNGLDRQPQEGPFEHKWIAGSKTPLENNGMFEDHKNGPQKYSSFKDSRKSSKNPKEQNVQVGGKGTHQTNVNTEQNRSPQSNRMQSSSLGGQVQSVTKLKTLRDQQRLAESKSQKEDGFSIIIREPIKLKRKEKNGQVHTPVQNGLQSSPHQQSSTKAHKGSNDGSVLPLIGGSDESLASSQSTHRHVQQGKSPPKKGRFGNIPIVLEHEGDSLRRTSSSGSIKRVQHPNNPVLEQNLHHGDRLSTEKDKQRSTSINHTSGSNHKQTRLSSQEQNDQHNPHQQGGSLIENYRPKSQQVEKSGRNSAVPGFHNHNTFQNDIFETHSSIQKTPSMQEQKSHVGSGTELDALGKFKQRYKANGKDVKWLTDWLDGKAHTFGEPEQYKPDSLGKKKRWTGEGHKLAQDAYVPDVQRLYNYLKPMAGWKSRLSKKEADRLRYGYGQEFLIEDRAAIDKLAYHRVGNELQRQETRKWINPDGKRVWPFGDDERVTPWEEKSHAKPNEPAFYSQPRPIPVEKKPKQAEIQEQPVVPNQIRSRLNLVKQKSEDPSKTGRNNKLFKLGGSISRRFGSSDKISTSGQSFINDGRSFSSVNSQKPPIFPLHQSQSAKSLHDNRSDRDDIQKALQKGDGKVSDSTSSEGKRTKENSHKENDGSHRENSLSEKSPLVTQSVTHSVKSDSHEEQPSLLNPLNFVSVTNQNEVAHLSTIKEVDELVRTQNSLNSNQSNMSQSKRKSQSLNRQSSSKTPKGPTTPGKDQLAPLKEGQVFGPIDERPNMPPTTSQSIQQEIANQRIPQLSPGDSDSQKSSPSGAVRQGIKQSQEIQYRNQPLLAAPSQEQHGLQSGQNSNGQPTIPFQSNVRRGIRYPTFEPPASPQGQDQNSQHPIDTQGQSVPLQLQQQSRGSGRQQGAMKFNDAAQQQQQQQQQKDGGFSSSPKHIDIKTLGKADTFTESMFSKNRKNKEGTNQRTSHQGDPSRNSQPSVLDEGHDILYHATKQLM